jgi:hypothetical protein
MIVYKKRQWNHTQAFFTLPDHIHNLEWITVSTKFENGYTNQHTLSFPHQNDLLLIAVRTNISFAFIFCPIFMACSLSFLSFSILYKSCLFCILIPSCLFCVLVCCMSCLRLSVMLDVIALALHSYVLLTYFTVSGKTRVALTIR